MLSAGLAIPVFGLLGLYRLIFRHSGLPAVFTIAQAMVVGIDGIPRTIGLIQPLILFFGVSGSRLVARSWLGNLEQLAQALTGSAVGRRCRTWVA